MKQGTLYATRLKKRYAKFRQSVDKPEIPEENDDPLRRLGIAVLAVAYDDDLATRAIDRIFETLVDWNEIRVSSAFEVHRAAGGKIPNGNHHCQRLISALESIYERENQISLGRLGSMGRREARQYLETLRGADDYTVASVLLWSLGGHGIPVNDRLLKAMQGAELVHPSASRGEVQAFLERHISAADAREFIIRMRSFSPDKLATKKRSPGARKQTSPKKNGAK